MDRRSEQEAGGSKVEHASVEAGGISVNFNLLNNVPQLK
jgi:hypothetical protein